MPLLITKGLGAVGDGSGSGLLSVEGLGDAGLPITCPSASLQLLAVESFGPYLLVSFSFPVLVGGNGLRPEAWAILESEGAYRSQVLAVSQFSPYQIRLQVEEQTRDAIYQLKIPETGIVSSGGGLPLAVPYTKSFTGFGTPVTVVMARSPEARVLEIVFNEPVLEADALKAENYTVSPSLQVLGVEKVTSTIYRLRTSKQTELQQYDVDVTGIRDAAHNPMA